MSGLLTLLKAWLRSIPRDALRRGRQWSIHGFPTRTKRVLSKPVGGGGGGGNGFPLMALFAVHSVLKGTFVSRVELHPVRHRTDWDALPIYNISFGFVYMSCFALSCRIFSCWLTYSYFVLCTKCSHKQSLSDWVIENVIKSFWCRFGSFRCQFYIGRFLIRYVIQFNPIQFNPIHQMVVFSFDMSSNSNQRICFLRKFKSFHDW